METIVQRNLEGLCRRKKYKEIIDQIMEIPENERDYKILAPYIRKYLLHAAFHGGFEAQDYIGDGEDCIHIPDWNVVITPQIGTVTHRSIVLDLYLYFPAWGREVYECSAGTGTDLKQALGMATGSFLFSLMDGIGAMVAKDRPRLLNTEFAGRSHQFQVYLSNIVGMGSSPQSAPDVYWKLLEEDVRKRLGNQEFCLVKVYGAKVNGQVTAECRIDDRKSEELSGKLAGLIQEWEDSQFASHKQFILIRQEEKTLRPNFYAGAKGKEHLKKSVIKAAKLFHQADTQELYDTLEDRIAEEVKDKTLAKECCIFLPELCAQNAFREISYSEQAELVQEEGVPITCYLSQLADYWAIWDAFEMALQDGAFGEEGDKIYQEYILASSVFQVVKQMQEKQADLSACRFTPLLYQVGSGFELR